MNTHQLQCAIDCDVKMNVKIIGTYSADNIPNKPHTLPFGFIVNTDPHNLPGQHWIAFYADEHGVLEAFDSFGISPSKYSPCMKQFMKTFNNVVVNNKRVQSLESNVCGQYCLFYLMCRCRGYFMSDVINIFSNDSTLNDQFVYRFIDDRFYCCMHSCSSFCQICKNKL